MDPETRRRLLRLSAEFYAAHAEGFDASRGHQPWPGWYRMERLLREAGESERSDEDAAVESAAERAVLRVLDIGCGNARLARFLSDAGHRLAYQGVDGNAALLAAARERLPPALAEEVSLVQADFLSDERPGHGLPEGPFDLVALFGVLHHVPGSDWRRALLAAAARRLAPGGILALAAWQFAGRQRFARRMVPWSETTTPDEEGIDVDALEAGDFLLRFGPDPDRPARYCHQVSDSEFEAIHESLREDGLPFSRLDDYRADGGEGDLNRYLILRRE